MSQPPRQRLKVFQAQFGFYDSVVATPSRAAALAAWGTHQNLFTSGDARVTTDEAAAAAALQHPGMPLRRAVGSKDAFMLEPASLPTLPAAAEKPKGTRKAKSGAPARHAPDRADLDAAEAALRELVGQRKQEEADLRREEKSLTERRAAAQKAYVEARKQAVSMVDVAREQYRKKSGDIG